MTSQVALCALVLQFALATTHFCTSVHFVCTYVLLSHVPTCILHVHMKGLVPATSPWCVPTFTKTKGITRANHKGHTQYSEQNKTQSNYMKAIWSTGKHTRMSHNWFWLYFWLQEEVAWVFFSHLCSVVMQNQIPFQHTNENALVK